ncbi:MAG: hypothetical protein ACRERC_08560 [Candidatus Binatia bacterium]
MAMLTTRAWRCGLAFTLGVLILVGPGVLAARAAAPVGACCLANGECLSEVEIVCERQGGNFIGPDTSCVMIECPTGSVQVPLLSLFGIVAAAGALGGLGMFRLLMRRRAG